MRTVDIVVPCYNYGRFLTSCVESVIAQTGVNVRALIIDDASSDNSEQVGRALEVKYSQVQYRRHLTNKGHLETYNEGLLGWASGDYCLLLSADDMLAPGALSRAIGVMERHPEVGMTYGLALVFQDEAELSSAALPAVDDYQVIPGSEFLRRCFEMGNAVETPTAVLRTAVQQKIGGYLPDLPHSGDMEMWMRCAVHGPIGVVRSVQGYVRRHGANMSDRFYAQQVRDCDEVLQACDKILVQWGSRFPQSSLWRESVTRRLAEQACQLASHAFDRNDLVACQRCLEFALRTYPGIKNTRSWKRVHLKQSMGARLWSYTRPLWRRLKAAELRTIGLADDSAPRLSGWWPNAQ